MQKRSRLRGFVIGCCRVLAVLYFGVLAILAGYQRSLIFPGGQPHDPRPFRVTPAAGCRVVDDGAGVVGLFEPGLTPGGQPCNDVKDRPTLLYFYGNDSCVLYAREDMERFRRAGMNIFIAEYPGYGMTSGAPSERGCFAAAGRAYVFLTQREGIAPSHIVIMGWSLGSAVAIDLASRVPSSALIVVSPFTNMADEASAQYPIYPAWMIRLVLRSPFASDRKIGRVACPILDIHARDDNVVPFAMSERLMAHAHRPVTRLVLARGGHAALFSAGAAVDRQVIDFIDAAVGLGGAVRQGSATSAGNVK